MYKYMPSLYLGEGGRTNRLFSETTRTAGNNVILELLGADDIQPLRACVTACVRALNGQYDQMTRP